MRAAATEQDGAFYLTAAFTGLRRGELLGLRWRDVDFTSATLRVSGSVSFGELTTPKSGKVRSVPMVAEVAAAVAKLSQREQFTGDDDQVFPGKDGGLGDGSAVRRRYEAARKRAGLRPLRFHDLRHTFGSLAINFGSLVEVQGWMGHSNVQTTMRYLHYKSRGDEAARLGQAFQVRAPASTTASTEGLQGFTGINSNAAAEEEIPAAIAYLVDRRESA